MNLNETQNIARAGSKPIIITVGFVVISLLIYLAWFNFFRDKPNPIFGVLPEPSIPNEATIKEQTRVNIAPFVNFGNQKIAPVYKIKKVGYSTSEAQALAKKLQFDGVWKKKEGSYKSELIVWKETEKTLEINRTFGGIFMRDRSAQTGLDSKKITNAEDAIETAEKFLKNKDLAKDDLLVDGSQTRYLIYGAFQVAETRDPKLASAFEIHFVRKLGKYATTSILSSPKSNVIVQVGGNGKVLFLSYKYIGIDEQEIATYPLKDFSEIEKLVKEKKFKIPAFYQDIEEYVPNPTSVSFSVIRIVLYHDGYSKYLQPIFILEGTAARGGNTARLDAYLPAVQDKYLKH